MQYTIVQCQVCDKKFSIMSWKLDQGRGKTCSKECRHKFQKQAMGGKNSLWWKGGIAKTELGYILIEAKEHPYVKANGYVLEHRLVMEKHLGRYLFAQRGCSS
jgi:hypothetical protein